MTERGKDRERALSFGDGAERYDAMRPNYPADLYEVVLNRAGARPAVLDIGAGTGQAAGELAARGATVVALEPDARLAPVLAGKQLANVSTVVAPFDEYEGPTGEFDAVVSAQAWHWVVSDEAVAEVARLLRPGGAFAVWWNLPHRERHPSSAALDVIYGSVAPELLERSVMTSAQSDGRHTKGIHASRYFEQVEIRHYNWSEKCTADAYTRLLETHSDHHTLPEPQRSELFERIRSHMELAGGLTFRYETKLTIATRVAEPWPQER